MLLYILNNLRPIIFGWSLLLTGQTPAYTYKRLEICKQCKYRKRVFRLFLFCRICYCYMPAKARVWNAHCVKGFWPEDKKRPVKMQMKGGIKKAKLSVKRKKKGCRGCGKNPNV